MNTVPMAAVVLMAHALCVQAQPAAKAREECRTLAAAALPMARQLLQSHGEFAPYGVGLSGAREVVALGVEPSPRVADDGAMTGELRRSLDQALAAGRVRATALVYEAAITSASGARSDAIALALTHRDGYSAVVVYPYRFSGAELKLGEPQIIERRERPPDASPRRK